MRPAKTRPAPTGQLLGSTRDPGDHAILLNILWLVLSGFWLFLGYMLVGLLCCITIIGIPLGVANFKMIPISLWPLGHDIVAT